MNWPVVKIVEQTKTKDEEIIALRTALDRLVHSIDDEADSYGQMDEACIAALALLPDYQPINDDSYVYEVERRKKEHAKIA